MKVELIQMLAEQLLQAVVDHDAVTTENTLALFVEEAAAEESNEQPWLGSLSAILREKIQYEDRWVLIGSVIVQHLGEEAATQYIELLKTFVTKGYLGGPVISHINQPDELGDLLGMQLIRSHGARGSAAYQSLLDTLLADSTPGEYEAFVVPHLKIKDENGQSIEMLIEQEANKKNLNVAVDAVPFTNAEFMKIHHEVIKQLEKDHLSDEINELEDEIGDRLQALQSRVEPVMANSYVALQKEAAYQELMLELSALQELFDEFAEERETLKEKFKALCREREQRNQGTFLDFSAMPSGECNALYWQIAQKLFQPSNMTEMLAILMPSVKFQLETNVSISNYDPAKKPSQQALVCSITKKAIALSGPVADAPDILGNYVVVDGVALDVREVVVFDFNIHTMFEDRLRQAYPLMAQQLYGWNDGFEKLANDITAVKNKGTTPREAIMLLKQRLELSGTKHTGSEEASCLGRYGCLAFQCYLEGLPNECKQLVLAAQTQGGRSIQSVMQHLAEGQCVEMAAGYLDHILSNPHNNKIFDSLPVMKESGLKEIKKVYKKPIDPVRVDRSCVVPANIADRIYGKVTLLTEEDYLDWLVTLPEAMYPLFVASALHGEDGNSLSAELVNFIKSGVLTPAQKNAFIAAILQHHKRFGLDALVKFIYELKDIELTSSLFKIVVDAQAREELIKCVSRQLHSMKPLDYHDRAVENWSDNVANFISALPEKERLFVVVQPNDKGNTLLHECISHQRIKSKRFPDGLFENLALFDMLLGSLALLAVVAASFFVAIPLFAWFLPPAFPIVMNVFNYIFSTNFNEVTKEVVKCNTPLLENILNLLPAEDRLTAMNTKNQAGKSALDLMKKHLPAKQMREMMSRLLPLQQKAGEKPHGFYAFFGVGRDKKEKSVRVANDIDSKCSVGITGVERDVVVAPVAPAVVPAAGMLRR